MGFRCAIIWNAAKRRKKCERKTIQSIMHPSRWIKRK